MNLRLDLPEGLTERMMAAGADSLAKDWKNPFLPSVAQRCWEAMEKSRVVLPVSLNQTTGTQAAQNGNETST